MNSLDIGEQLVDRTKSSFYLYYLARAANKVAQREISRRKVELSIKQLKKISTKDLHKHVEELEGHITEALHRERQVQAHQKAEESVHHELTHKITRLEHKLGRYLETQEERKTRIEEIEQKIKEKFKTKQEKLHQLKKDLEKLIKLYHHAKKDKKHTPEQLLSVARRIAQVNERIAALK